MAYKFLSSISIVLLSTVELIACDKQDLIVVNKKNIVHRFVKSEQWIDSFLTNFFPNWENDTFDVFDSVKDPQGIAIDLGAWVGTTAIYLSKKFFHVIAVDGDNISIDCLKKNLEASECFNISICQRPVLDTPQTVIFGPRSNGVLSSIAGKLNTSISYIKNISDNLTDYSTESITFKQIVHDYVYSNPALAEHKISFIKCDIEGGEENILQDLLSFASYTKVKVYVSFHLSWWKSKKITDFEHLFKLFKTNVHCDNACEYLQTNPWASILFEPLDNNFDSMKHRVTC